VKPLPYFIYTIAAIFIAVGSSTAQQKTGSEPEKEAAEQKSEPGLKQEQQEEQEEQEPKQDEQTADTEGELPGGTDLDETEAVADTFIKSAQQIQATAAIDLKKFKAISAEGKPEKIKSAFPSYSGPRTPESPVFVLLDLSPSEIQKPSGSRPLAISIARDLTAFDNTLLPLNLAVELSPYWIDSHSGVDWKEYTDSGIEQLYQNLSLSVGASTPSRDSDESGYTSIAFGVRTGIDGRSYDCEQLEPIFYRYNDERSREKLRAMDAAMFDGTQLHGFEEIDADFKKNWLKDKQNREAIRKATDQCTRKRDWAIDAAFAASFDIPDQAIKHTELSALAGWLTFGLLGDTVSLVPMTRVRSDLLYLDDSRTMIDLGAQFVVAAKLFAFSAEFIYRNVFDKPEENNKSSFYRTGLGIDAALSSDIWLNVSFGKNYADLFPDEDLFVKTSLRFDLGERSLGIDPESVGIEYRD
jgi:hypothetical protein